MTGRGVIPKFRPSMAVMLLPVPDESRTFTAMRLQFLATP
jgi:hypothetical protein